MPSDDWEGFSVDNQMNLFWLNNKKVIFKYQFWEYKVIANR